MVMKMDDSKSDAGHIGKICIYTRKKPVSDDVAYVCTVIRCKRIIFEYSWSTTLISIDEPPLVTFFIGW